jgi:hypothetical protein
MKVIKKAKKNEKVVKSFTAGAPHAKCCMNQQ